jgi:hypothetical protein
MMPREGREAGEDGSEGGKDAKKNFSLSFY